VSVFEPADERWFAENFLASPVAEGPPKVVAPAAHPQRPNSWQPVDILSAGVNPPAPPTIAGLLYADRSHLLSGETEAVKSWQALVFCAELIQAGRPVAYVDYENGPAEILARLRHLGVSDEEVASFFLYFNPDDAIAHEPASMRDLLTVIGKRGPALVVLDSWIGALQTHGLDPNVGVDIERWRRSFLEPIRSVCPATLILDHVPKAKDSRGRFSIGSERKASAVEIHLGSELITPLARGKTGLVRLMTHKDRGGHLPRPRAAELELRSDPETLAMTWKFRHPETQSEDGFRPTFLMERVSRHLEALAAPVTRAQIANDVTGRRQYLFDALKFLVEEGFAGENGAGGIFSERPFREDEDA
jgi:hypothetical protein